MMRGTVDWDMQNVKLALKKGYQPELFTDCQEVGPDAEKADKVLRTLNRKMYLEDFGSSLSGSPLQQMIKSR